MTHIKFWAYSILFGYSPSVSNSLLVPYPFCQNFCHLSSPSTPMFLPIIHAYPSGVWPSHAWLWGNSHALLCGLLELTCGVYLRRQITCVPEQTSTALWTLLSFHELIPHWLSFITIPALFFWRECPTHLLYLSLRYSNLLQLLDYVKMSCTTST